MLAERAWVEVADLIDLQLCPLGLVAMNELAPLPGHTVVDIGCGAGQTVRQLADRVGPTGLVIGVDIAPRLRDLARSRMSGLSQVQLIEADAASLHLPDETADGMFSRFGVMALDEPTSAFRNFRRMIKQGGRLSFVCWRSLEENELDLIPLQAAELGYPIDDTPFRFARRDDLNEVLRSAGFRDIRIQPSAWENPARDAVSFPSWRIEDSSRADDQSRCKRWRQPSGCLLGRSCHGKIEQCGRSLTRG